MSDHRQYLAEEIAVEHADGLITRREALRRLGLLGFGLAAAGGVLAACTPSEESASPPAGDAPATGQKPAEKTEPVTFAGPEGRTLQGAWAAAKSARGAGVVVHENQGLTDHIRSVAGRLAADGFSALAIDLLSAEGGTGKFADPAEATAALGAAPAERFLADMRAGIAELGKRAPGLKRGAVGFCFGGGRVWQLIAAEPDLNAAVPFYGEIPQGADLTGSKAAVMAIYAEADARINASRDRAEEALKKAGLTHSIVTLPGTHAFFNDTRPSYDAGSAQMAYAKLLKWFTTHLG